MWIPIGRKKSIAALAASTVVLLAASATPAGAVFGQLKVIGSSGSGDGQFTKIVGIATAPARTGAPDGQLFVADRIAGHAPDFIDKFRIQEFSQQGVFRRKIAEVTGNPITGSLPDAFGGMVADPVNSVLYVAKDAQTTAVKDRIEKYSLDTGAKLTDFDPDTGTLNTPGPIALDPVLGDLFVAGVTDAGDPKLQKYSSAGVLKGSKFGSAAPQDGPTAAGDLNANGIDGLAVRHDSTGGGAKVYVLDTWLDDPDNDPPADDAARVQRFNVTGDVSAPKNQWSYENGSQFKSDPTDATTVAFQNGGLEVDPASKHLYLTTDANADQPTANGVIELTEGGTEVKRWGSLGSGTCQFALQSDPPYITLDSSGNVYAVDVNNIGSAVQRVLKFGEGGSGCGFDNQPPHAEFTPTPQFPVKNQTVQFDGSGSSDADGSISKYEWDLDGNGTFEADTGTTDHTSKSYAQVGPVDVQLRVTDNQGATDTFTQTISVTGQAPSASFNFSPSAPQTGQTVNFNGSGSSDADGSITKYDWDLDGDGSFETLNGGPMPSASYNVAKTYTIKLRVTDNDNQTASTTRQLTVSQKPVDPPPSGGGGGGGGGGGPAPVAPSNTFSFVAINAKGTPAVSVTVPGAGTIEASGAANVSGAAKRIALGSATTSVPKAGTYKLTLKLSGAAKKILKKKKKLKASLLVKFTPTGGAAGQRTGSLTLKVKKKK